jgi:hypothetical protein
VAHVAWLSAICTRHHRAVPYIQAPTLDTPPSVTPASATAPARRYLAGLHDHGSATKKLDCVCKPRAERSGIFGASAKCGASMSEHELIPPPRVECVHQPSPLERRVAEEVRMILYEMGRFFLHRRSSIYVSTHANPSFQTQLQLFMGYAGCGYAIVCAGRRC